jgi:betaine-aldehyde dehydrogenase
LSTTLLADLPSSVLIGGELRRSRSGAELPAVNPATLETVATIPRCDASDAEDAVDAARQAFGPWRELALAERVHLVLELAARVEGAAEELAQLDTLDNGSPIRVMRNDARMAVDALRYLAGIAGQVRGETVPTEPGRLNYTLRQPFGVVGRIIPFNHPLLFAASRIAAPLLMGNTVVLKPSEHTSLSALKLAALSEDLFPAGVLNVVTGLGSEVGDRLVTHPDVRRLAFIGGAGTGRAIQARAAQSGVKSVTLELGGKNPLVVFPGVDLEAVAAGVVRGMNATWQGQSCGSTSRLLVHSDLHDELVDKVVQRLEAMRIGPPADDATEIGAVVNQAQYDKVLQYVDLGRGEGARLVTGGTPPEDEALQKGLFLRPAVFDGVDPGSRLAQEEIFGAVLSVITFRSFDEAIRIANGVCYGLTASVWTEDLRTAHRFAEQVEAGYVWVNDSSRHFEGTAFGGVKESGLGREEGIEELESYTLAKNVNVRLA